MTTSTPNRTIRFSPPFLRDISPHSPPDLWQDYQFCPGILWIERPFSRTNYFRTSHLSVVLGDMVGSSSHCYFHSFFVRMVFHTFAQCRRIRFVSSDCHKQCFSLWRKISAWKAISRRRKKIGEIAPTILLLWISIVSLNREDKKIRTFLWI